MDTDKKPEETTTPPASTEGTPEQGAAADALGSTPETIDATSGGPIPNSGDPTPPSKPPKKSGLKSFFRRFNVYLLLFILIVVVAGAISVVSYLNSRKTPVTPGIVNQTLTPDTLKQLANSDATVGGSGQTLTVQGNAVFDGQVLVRSNLNVAGTIQLGGPLSLADLTVSDTANLANTQVNSLQVANGTTFQGTVTVQHDLNVAGAASFSGSLTTNQLTVTKLIMSGNAQLQVPNHVAFTGATPGRAIGNALGGGGSVSVYGSDVSGTVNVNTGNSPSAGCFLTVNFNNKFAAIPHVIVTPIGEAAGQTQYYVNRSASNFSICTVNAPPANKVFAYDYFVAGL